MYTRAVGKHHPMCQGQCLVPAVGCLNMCPLSTSLIVGPSALWYYQFYATSNFGILSLVTLLLVGSLGCLFSAYCTEPGLLPTIDEDIEDIANNDPHAKPTRPKKLVLLPGEGKGSDLVEFRAKYCRDTGNTIENFDHFCPWTGNAVGVRNYRYYFCFLVFTTALALTVGGTSAVAVIILFNDVTTPPAPPKPPEPVQQSIILLWVLILFCSLILCLVGSLLSYHVPLVSRNMTTNEDIKGVYNGGSGGNGGSGRNNPYDKGCSQNWCHFLSTTIKCPRESYVCSDPTPGMNQKGGSYDRCCSEGENNGLLRDTKTHVHV